MSVFEEKAMTLSDEDISQSDKDISESDKDSSQSDKDISESDKDSSQSNKVMPNSDNNSDVAMDMMCALFGTLCSTKDEFQPGVKEDVAMETNFTQSAGTTAGTFQAGVGQQGFIQGAFQPCVNAGAFGLGVTQGAYQPSVIQSASQAGVAKTAFQSGIAQTAFQSGIAQCAFQPSVIHGSGVTHGAFQPGSPGDESRRLQGIITYLKQIGVWDMISYLRDLVKMQMLMLNKEQVLFDEANMASVSHEDKVRLKQGLVETGLWEMFMNVWNLIMSRIRTFGALELGNREVPSLMRMEQQ